MHDSYAVQEFLGLHLGRESPPDETTIMRFRHLIEEHKVAPKMLETVNRHMAARGIRVRQGTIVDATVIRAPTSTRRYMPEQVALCVTQYLQKLGLPDQPYQPQRENAP